MAADIPFIPYWTRRLERAVLGAPPRKRLSPDSPSSTLQQAAPAREPRPSSLLLPYWKKRIARMFTDDSSGRTPGPNGKPPPPDSDSASAETQHQSNLGPPLSSKVRYPTFAAIGAADVARPLINSSLGAIGLRALGGVGGGGLMAVSVMDLKNAETTDDQLDAVNSLAWGSQAIATAGSAVISRGAAMSFGFAGAFVQAVVGVRRIAQGIDSGDRRLTGLGAIDVGSGVVWFAGTALSWPVFLGSYALMMLGREAYVNDKARDQVLQGIRNDVRLLGQGIGVIAEPDKSPSRRPLDSWAGPSHNSNRAGCLRGACSSKSTRHAAHPMPANDRPCPLTSTRTRGTG